MENPSYSYDIQALSAACGLLRLDPNYLHGRRDSHNDDDDDDPLGRPEMTVNINDDWTVSPDESCHSFQDDLSEDIAHSNDEVNVDDNNLVASFYNETRTLPSRQKSSSDDEDHVVPSVIPTKVSRLIHDKELTLSDTEEKLDSEEEREEVKGVEEEEATEEDVDAGVDLAKKTAHRYHDDKETRDRSNPQPP